MKANGNKDRISDTAKAHKSGQMEQYTKGGSEMTNHTVKDAYSNPQAIFIPVVGKEASTMDLVSTFILMVRNMKESGKKISNTVMALKLGATIVLMKDNIIRERSMALVSLLGRMGHTTMVNSKKTSSMATESITGMMV